MKKQAGQSFLTGGYRPDSKKKRTPRLRIAAAIALVCVIGYSAYRLVSYGTGLARVTRQTEKMRSVYQEASAEQPAYPDEAEAPAAASAAPVPALTAGTNHFRPTAAPARTAAPAVRRLSVTTGRFLELQHINPDIQGWIKINDLLDEAIVQRNNTYYLDRDYEGRPNEQGALFLDERCRTGVAPSVYVVYGHNMKTGTMFGKLRSYEKKSTFISHPWIQLDTPYESGEYRVFAVCRNQVSGEGAIPYYRLANCGLNERWRILKSMLDQSLYDCSTEVSADNSFLILVTCTGNQDERLLICARKVQTPG